MITKEELKEGEVLLHTIKTTKTDKIQLGLSESLPIEDSPLRLLNKDDPRFEKIQKFGHAYLTADLDTVKEYFPKLKKQLNEIKNGLVNELKVSIKNPELEGERLRVQIKETTGADLATEYAETLSSSRRQRIGELTAGYEKLAKRAGKDGPFLLKDGSPIFREESVVFGEPKHILLKHNGSIPTLEVISNGVDMIGEPIVTEKKKSINV